MRFHNMPALFVRSPNHRAFQHGGVRQQRRFDLWPSDVVTRRDDHIIRPRRKVKAPCLILPKAVARQVPAVFDIGALAVVSHIAAPGRPAHGQTADSAARHLSHVVTHDLGLIARHGPTGATGAVVFKAVGDKDMQHLCRANAIQHRLTRAFDPFVIDRGWQSFPRTDGGAQRG